MALTPAQNTTLKAAILANPTWSAFPNDAQGNFDLALLLNAEASPIFTVWKTSVLLTEIMTAIDGAELDGLTTANTNRLNLYFLPHTALGRAPLPNESDKRQLFDGVFSGAGGNITRPKLLTLYKRLANEVEKIFADTTNGDGSDSTPATITFEGTISRQEVETARNS